MAVFTAIGLALGASAGTAAFVTGVAATAVVGAGAVAYGESKGAAAASRVPSFSGIDTRIAQDVGEVTEAEAQTVAKKRAYRSGVLFTSPVGLDSDARTSSAKLR